MPRNRDESPAVRVYTVCDESRYLIVRNVPELGCRDEVLKLFESYGDIEECKPMDAEDCEPFTDVYWINFFQISNARFAKKKLDEFVFLGNRLQVSYAPQFESLSDTKAKLEGRRKEVLSRITPRSNGSKPQNSDHSVSGAQLQTNFLEHKMNYKQKEYMESAMAHHMKNENRFINSVSSNKEYFSSPSMNETVQLVREKLTKIQSSGQHIQAEPAVKKIRVDNRRRI